MWDSLMSHYDAEPLSLSEEEKHAEKKESAVHTGA